MVRIKWNGEIEINTKICWLASQEQTGTYFLQLILVWDKSGIAHLSREFIRMQKIHLSAPIPFWLFESRMPTLTKTQLNESNGNRMIREREKTATRWIKVAYILKKSERMWHTHIDRERWREKNMFVFIKYHWIPSVCTFSYKMNTKIKTHDN